MAYGASGVYVGLLGQPTNTIQIPAATAFSVPAGNWLLRIGPYSQLQEYDIVMQSFRPITTDIDGLAFVQSDGFNWRVVNRTGTPVGAIITTAGSAMTASSPPTVTPSAGSSTWTPIIGGALSTTVTVVTGGQNYTYPPIVQIQAPSTGPSPSPNGPGFAATAHCAITSGAVSSVTIDNQGAGYQSAPTITFINDARDTAGSGATAQASLTGSGTLTGLVVNDFGTALTAVPTLTFSTGGSAATVIMDWSITGVTLTNAGSGYTASTNILLTTAGGLVAGTSALTNPLYHTGMFVPRPAQISTPTNGSGVLQAGSIIVDAGRYQAAPTLVIADGRIVGGPATTAAIIAPTMGGVTDNLLLFADPL